VPGPVTMPAMPLAGQCCPAVETVLNTIWLTRADLRKLFEGDRLGFELWLMLHGVREYRALAETGSRLRLELVTAPTEDGLPGVRPALTNAMKSIWRGRADLSRRFDAASAPGQQELVWWYFLCGVPEYGLSRFVTEQQRRYLNQPDGRVSQDAWAPLTRFMVEIWSRRADLRRRFPLAAKSGRERFLDWYFVDGLAELQFPDAVDRKQARILLAPLRGTPRGSPRVPRIARMIWSADDEVRRDFPDPESVGLRDWMYRDGAERYPILRRLLELESPARAPAVISAPDLPFGVNVVGYARGDFGIAEDARMAARALQARSIPVSLYNVEPSIEHSQHNRSVEALISDRLPYSVNLVCMSGMEAAAWAAAEGSPAFRGRHTIGCWPWELPRWPDLWRHAYDMLDELWAASRYTYDAYAKDCPKPVRHIPSAVAVEPTARRSRGGFGLASGRFTFLFYFDFLSSLARKNPFACFEAFRIAFPHGNEAVALVIKAMNVPARDPLWQRLLDETAPDPRVTIITETLDRGAVLDLCRACDCFVSLHRAEGFGRSLAEAMMLGKPVIATGYSGNMDFTVPGTAALVDHRLRPVGEGEYPFGDGQSWAEPDIGHAAWWMERLFRERPLRERLAAQGQALVAGTYAPDLVGREYEAALGQIASGFV